MGHLLFTLRNGRTEYFYRNNNLNKLIKSKNINEFRNIIEKTIGIKDLSAKIKDLYISMIAQAPKEKPNIEELLTMPSK